MFVKIIGSKTFLEQMKDMEPKKTEEPSADYRDSFKLDADPPVEDMTLKELKECILDALGSPEPEMQEATPEEMYNDTEDCNSFPEMFDALQDYLRASVYMTAFRKAYGKFCAFYIEEGDLGKYTFNRKTFEKDEPYTPSQADLFAQDWYVVPGHPTVNL